MNARIKIPADFALEPLTAVKAEITPLLDAHWAEIAHFDDIPLKPNWPVYERMAGAGMLLIYTARVDGVLCGYAVYLKIISMHYSICQAQQDIIWLSPQCRNAQVGYGLIAYSERDLKAKGVVLIQQHEKVAHPQLGALLASMNYTLMDRIWVKRL